MLYGQSKLKALVTNIAMQRIKAVEAADMNKHALHTMVHHGYVNNNYFRHALSSY